MKFTRTLLVFAGIAVAGMALLSEALAYVNVGMDPVTAYAPVPSAAGPDASGAGQPPEVKTFEVLARRFAFEPATIEVTEGDRVRLVVTSADGVHGVGIRKFKVNTLVPRGPKSVTIEFTATEAGTFPIVCSEACGDGHADMRGTLVVEAGLK